MLISKVYMRDRAVSYAKSWAFSRNPLYNDYTGIGGNCTNFVSQAVLAGSCIMNYTQPFGWYYLSDTDRTASWAGVDYFYNFITQNTGSGPVGREVDRSEVMPGDVVQLAREEGGYYHSLLVSAVRDGEIFVAAQSNDAFDRPLSEYEYDYDRFIHITHVNMLVFGFEDCYPGLISGTEIVRNEQFATLPPEPR